MGKNIEYSSVFRSLQKEIDTIFFDYDISGDFFVKGKRNSIKIFKVGEEIVNVKSFKIPFFINRIIYHYFRKSKARRSFEFALKLEELKIGTPQPIAYFEEYTFLGLSKSYYASRHLDCDLTYRELVETDYPDGENILRQFTQFTYTMHEHGIEFKDHTPGNTLIKNLGNGKYAFYLVDLNRMSFHNSMSFQARMKNLSKITPKKDMVVIMSNEYAKLYGKEEQEVFDLMWKFTQHFQYRFNRKKRIKKKIKFWKK